MATPTQKKFVEALRAYGVEISDKIADMAAMDLKNPKKTSDATDHEAPAPVKETKSRKKKAEEPKKEEEAPVKETKSRKKKAEEPETKQTVRMARITKAVKDMILAGYPDANEKTFKDFKTYINDLTDDDFKSCNLNEHANKFIEYIKTSSETEEKTEVVSEKKQPVEVSIEDVRKTSDDYIIVGVTVNQIKAVDVTNATDVIVNVPDDDDDGDVEEVKFNGHDYVVTAKHGRVYKVHDSGDIFQGFIGLGDFADMKL